MKLVYIAGYCLNFSFNVDKTLSRFASTVQVEHVAIWLRQLGATFGLTRLLAGISSKPIAVVTILTVLQCFFL